MAVFLGNVLAVFDGFADLLGNVFAHLISHRRAMLKRKHLSQKKRALVKVSFNQETTLLKYGRNYGSVNLDGTGPRFARKNLKAQAEHA